MIYYLVSEARDRPLTHRSSSSPPPSSLSCHSKFKSGWVAYRKHHNAGSTPKAPACSAIPYLWICPQNDRLGAFFALFTFFLRRLVPLGDGDDDDDGCISSVFNFFFHLLLLLLSFDDGVFVYVYYKEHSPSASTDSPFLSLRPSVIVSVSIIACTGMEIL